MGISNLPGRSKEAAVNGLDILADTKKQVRCCLCPEKLTKNCGNKTIINSFLSGTYGC